MNTRHINFLHKQLDEKPPKRGRTKWVFLLVIIGIFGFLTYSYVSANKDRFLNPLDYDPVTLEPKEPEGFFKKLTYLVFHKETKLEGQRNDRINILILGMGGLGHDGPYLTDTIMIASVRPSDNDVALVSIPRDLGVKIKDYGTRKINHANHFGEMEKENWGAAFATEVISETFDIDIPYYIRVDFQAFEDIIDEVGGVRVNVDRTFTDYMYPAPNDRYQTISFETGPQTMNGSTALKFVRSRHGGSGEGSDFARAARQQKVILALKEKVLSFGTLTNPVRIKKVIDALERHMTTNMEFDEILELVRVVRNLDTEKITTLVLDNGVNGYLVNSTGANGAFLLFPRTGNYNEINSAIKNVFDPEAIVESIDDTPEQEKPTLNWATIEIQNGTWRAGLAARVKQRLADEEFYIEDIGNTDPEFKPVISSGIYKISDKESLEVVEALQDELHMPTKETLPDGTLSPATSTDILIILGDDFIE
ncbi:LCP family protein [Candidatus Parcubacteria bacterium]|jgi:polyisoprenyl-teichoic acid--peptidoglycan teichoic acid transferase|nr:LCP family protein [Candidatus Parcubacteria bacterium]MBT3949051.1 LCP family protein [Candidatus Parcubacteria bacterium]